MGAGAKILSAVVAAPFVLLWAYFGLYMTHYGVTRLEPVSLLIGVATIGLPTAALILVVRQNRRNRRLDAVDTDLWQRLAAITNDRYADQARMAVTARDATGTPVQLRLTPGPGFPVDQPRLLDRLANTFAITTGRQPGAVTASRDGLAVWLTVKASGASAAPGDKTTAAGADAKVKSRK